MTTLTVETMTKKIELSPKKLLVAEASDADASGFDLCTRIDDDEDDVCDTSPYLRQVLPSWGWDIITKYELQASETPVEAVTELFLLAAHLLERTSLLASRNQAITAKTAYRIALHEAMIADARLLLPFCLPLSEEVSLDIIDNKMVWLHDQTNQLIARLG